MIKVIVLVPKVECKKATSLKHGNSMIIYRLTQALKEMERTVILRYHGSLTWIKSGPIPSLRQGFNCLFSNSQFHN